jgi:protoheme IX farnesyltransferase
LVALTKPTITLASVMMAACGLVIAPSSPGVTITVGALLGTALVVASANALNMVLERDCDAQMERTRHRPLPTGRLGSGMATVFGVALGLAGIAVLTLSVNPVAAGLALFALVAYVAVYTPLKRVTPLALLVGAIPGAIPVLIGWAAATQDIGLPGLVLFGVVFLWQMPHFLAIALRRREDYARAGFKIVSVVRGEDATRKQAMAYCMALLPTSLLLVPLGAAGGIYFAVAGALGIWLIIISFGLFGSPKRTDAWARGLFRASLVYIPGLTAALMLDRLLG